MTIGEFIGWMMAFLLFFVIIAFVCLWVEYTGKKQKIKEQEEFIEELLGSTHSLEEDNKRLLREYEYSHHRYNNLLNDYWDSLDEIEELQNKTQENQNTQEIKEAVKYAMKSAHPDNGGDAKDFMKFRELYNKIK